jgi:hypothetical protein
MHTPTRPEDRVAELEDALKEKERRLQQVNADLDRANDLVERQNEHVQDCHDVIEAWKEAFDMRPIDRGGWTWATWVAACEEYHDKYVDLARKWNRNVADFNAAIKRPRNVGRPLAASEAQQQIVLKLRRASKSLRSIAEEILPLEGDALVKAGRRPATSSSFRLPTFTQAVVGSVHQPVPFTAAADVGDQLLPYRKRKDR